MNGLPERGVDVWILDLDTVTGAEADARRILSASEQDRATRYRFDRHRNRFRRRRLFLRILLGTYLGIPARDLTFDVSPQGKLSLPGEPVHFNISDSEGWAVFAFSKNTPLGIDIEFARPLDDLPQLVSRYFSPSEQKALLELPPDLHRAAFYHIWTQKEAFIKAIGLGLSYPLDAFDVQPDPRQPGAILSARDHPGPWVMHTFSPVPGYHAAVCHAAPELPVQIRPLKIS